jgi:hypothetical protein
MTKSKVSYRLRFFSVFFIPFSVIPAKAGIQLPLSLLKYKNGQNLQKHSTERFITRFDIIKNFWSLDSRLRGNDNE